MGARGLAAVATLLVLVSLASLPAHAAGEDPPPLTNVEWSASGGPVVLATSIEVPEDERLVIGPGVEVRLDPGASIQVKGELRVEGTKAEPVRFIANASGPIKPRSWGEVRLHQASAGRYHTVSWAHFEGADKGLNAIGTSLQVDNCTFDTCRYGILSMGDAELNVTDSTFDDCSALGVEWEADVTDSTFDDCSALGVEWEAGARGSARRCTFQGNNVALYCYNGASPLVEECAFDGNYHHLSFSTESNATVRRCTLANATGESFECYHRSSPTFEANTFLTDGAQAFVRNASRPRFVGNLSLPERVIASDTASYMVVLKRITVKVVDDDGRPLEGANVTIVGASGDVLSNGTTDALGRISGALISLYTLSDGGEPDAENPHNATVEWHNVTRSHKVDPGMLTEDDVLVLELAVSSPDETSSLGLVELLLIVALLAVVVVGAVVVRQRAAQYR
jgi:hypothetical protein